MGHSGLAVCKYGGSVLRSDDDFALVVHDLYRRVRRGQRVVAVVSALAGTTDRLLNRARFDGVEQDPHAVAGLVETGEVESVAMLRLALDRVGVPSEALDVGAISLRSVGEPLNATPIDVDLKRIHRVLEEKCVLVIPGFVGRDQGDRPTLFGRGGSDLTALFLAGQLGADHCRLIKDVDGLYERDPARPGPAPRRYDTMRWDDVLHLDGSIVQHKAVRFAREQVISFDVGELLTEGGTRVGPGSSEYASPRWPNRPLRIVLLGFGTVGQGVYRFAERLSDRLVVVRIATRDLEKAERAGAATSLLTDDVFDAVASNCDVVVEAIGGLDPARAAIESALHMGRHVVTANKAVVARYGPELHRAAERGKAKLRYSAAVGGGTPILEAVQRIAGESSIESIRAVLNGTTNVVLDCVSEGKSVDTAIREAKAAGFAEADPHDDLNGLDAAHKLTLLWHAWTGRWSVPACVDCAGASLERLTVLQSDSHEHEVIRQVAQLRRDGDVIHARVRLERLQPEDPLAGIRREQNAAVIRTIDGDSHVVRGRGAGRFPTAEAVVADLLDCADDVPDPVESMEFSVARPSIVPAQAVTC
ncbi:MAG: homoserine dehydrogenase [Planctomycetes bacterium]|nr:homoserine dehydrogenase [Planctomycetota bacterium]